MGILRYKTMSSHCNALSYTGDFRR